MSFRAHADRRDRKASRGPAVRDLIPLTGEDAQPIATASQPLTSGLEAALLPGDGFEICAPIAKVE